jgi:tetratricopeptide (TPR) repeat protein
MNCQSKLRVTLLLSGCLIGAAGCATAAGKGGVSTGAASAAPSAVATTEATDDRSAETLFRRGVELQHLGDSTRAEQYLGAAIARGYPIAQAFPALLDVCLASDRFDTALRYARARLLQSPDDWSLRYLVATLELSAGHDDRALPELRRLIDEKPDRPEAHYLLAVVARDHLGNRTLAARSFGTYLGLDPVGAHASEAKAFLRETARNAAEREGTP